MVECRLAEVAGLDRGCDLSFIRYEPVNAEGIGYVSHPYAAKCKIVTEFGFRLKEGEIADEDHYGNIIINYLEEKGISWVAWVFDPDWHPHIFSSWDTYELTGCGEFFKNQMQKNSEK
jgi:endoglucanase